MAQLSDFGHNVRTSGRRQGRRVRLFLSASIETISGILPVQLNSLSSGGAGVDVETAPRVGDELVVKCPIIGLDAFGTVVWSENKRCGIKFAERLDETALLTARSLSDHQPELIKAQRMAAAKAWSEGRRT